MTTAAAADPSVVPPGRLGRDRLLLLGGLFLLFVVVYQLSPVRTITDSAWVIPTSASLLRERNADVDEYPDAIRALDQWQLEVGADGHHYYKVPVGASVAALPFTAVALLLDGPLDLDLDRSMHAGEPTFLDPLVAAIYSAGTAALLVLIAWQLGASRRTGLLTGIVFAFGTAAWSTTSRSLWMHGPSMFALALALLLILRARGRPAFYGWAGVVLAFAVAVRPTNAISALALAIYVMASQRRRGAPIVIGGAATGLVLLALNRILYGTALPAYFSANRLELSSQFPEAVAGNLVSPARGILVYSPIVAFVVVGGIFKRRAGTWTGLDTGLALAILAHLAVISLFPHWWAGWAYGPRFMTDVLPWLMWFLIPVIAVAFPDGRSVATSALGLLFCLALLWSVFVNLRGALDDATFLWNLTPRNVDEAPERLWDWSDPPFLR